MVAQSSAQSWNWRSATRSRRNKIEPPPALRALNDAAGTAPWHTDHSLPRSRQHTAGRSRPAAKIERRAIRSLVFVFVFVFGVPVPARHGILHFTQGQHCDESQPQLLAGIEILVKRLPRIDQLLEIGCPLT